MYLKAYIQNLVKNGPVVSEKNMLKFSYINGVGTRSRNDIDLQYSHTFINSISCLQVLSHNRPMEVYSLDKKFLNFKRNVRTTIVALEVKLLMR